MGISRQLISQSVNKESDDKKKTKTDGVIHKSSQTNETSEIVF